MLMMRSMLPATMCKIDVWSKEDYTKLAKNCPPEDAGGRLCKQNFYDLYEQDLRIYHKEIFKGGAVKWHK